MSGGEASAGGLRCAESTERVRSIASKLGTTSEGWSWRRDRRSRPVAGRAMPHTTMGQRGIPYRPGRVFTISRLRRGTIAGWLCTTTTASSGPALRTRYHVPKLSSPGTSTTNRAHRSQGDDPSPCPAPALTGPLSPTSRETARSVRSIIPDRPRIGKTGLTLGMHAPSWTARSPVGASTE